MNVPIFCQVDNVYHLCEIEVDDYMYDPEYPTASITGMIEDKVRFFKFERMGRKTKIWIYKESLNEQCF